MTSFYFHCFFQHGQPESSQKFIPQSGQRLLEMQEVVLQKSIKVGYNSLKQLSSVEILLALLLLDLAYLLE